MHKEKSDSTEFLGGFVSSLLFLLVLKFIEHFQPNQNPRSLAARWEFTGNTRFHVVLLKVWKGAARIFWNALFSPVLFIIFGLYFRIYEGEVLKNKRGFCWEWSHSKNLSQFLHKYHNLRDPNRPLRPIFHDFTKLFLAQMLDQSHLLFFRDIEIKYLDTLMIWCIIYMNI